MAVSFEQTGDLVRRSGGIVNQAVDRGTDVLADRIEHYTNVAHDVSDVLRERGEAQAADVVQSVAGRINGVAGYLRERDGTALWSDAQVFARGRTWLLAGVGFVGGLAAARAVRSAAHDRGDTYVESYSQPQTIRYGT